MKQKNMLHCNFVVLLHPLPSANLLLSLLLAIGRRCEGSSLSCSKGGMADWQNLSFANLQKTAELLLQTSCMSLVHLWEDFKEGSMALEHVLAGKFLVE